MHRGTHGPSTGKHHRVPARFLGSILWWRGGKAHLHKLLASSLPLAAATTLLLPLQVLKHIPQSTPVQRGCYSPSAATPVSQLRRLSCPTEPPATTAYSCRLVACIESPVAGRHCGEEPPANLSACCVAVSVPAVCFAYVKRPTRPRTRRCESSGLASTRRRHAKRHGQRASSPNGGSFFRHSAFPPWPRGRIGGYVGALPRMFPCHTRARALRCDRSRAHHTRMLLLLLRWAAVRVLRLASSTASRWKHGKTGALDKTDPSLDCPSGARVSVRRSHPVVWCRRLGQTEYAGVRNGRPWPRTAGVMRSWAASVVIVVWWEMKGGRRGRGEGQNEKQAGKRKSPYHVQHAVGSSQGLTGRGTIRRPPTPHVYPTCLPQPPLLSFSFQVCSTVQPASPAQGLRYRGGPQHPSFGRPTHTVPATLGPRERPVMAPLPL